MNTVVYIPTACLGCSVENQVPSDAPQFRCFECMGLNEWDEHHLTLKFIPASQIGGGKRAGTPAAAPTDNRSTVPELMAAAAETFRQRNELYGNSYMDFDKLAMALFPEGITIETAEEWNRFGVLFFCIGKLQRYCKNFKKGGHKDSAHDLGVYSFMLEDLTAENK